MSRPPTRTPTTPCTHSYFIGNTVIENTGSILGDTVSQGAAAIQIGEPNSLRWAASRVSEGAGAPYDPLTITSQAGRRDSTIINSGTITGNIYLGAGNHVFQNSEEGQVTGSIDVDQRRVLTYNTGAVPAGYQLQVFRAGEAGGDDDDDEGGGGQVFTSLADFLAAIPDHHFEFDNAAPLIGNVTVHTYNGVTAPTAPTRRARSSWNRMSREPALGRPSTLRRSIAATSAVRSRSARTAPTAKA